MTISLIGMRARAHPTAPAGAVAREAPGVVTAFGCRRVIGEATPATVMFGFLFLMPLRPLEST